MSIQQLPKVSLHVLCCFFVLHIIVFPLQAQEKKPITDSTTSIKPPEGHVLLEGYVYEENNWGYVKNANITILKVGTNEIYGEGKTDKNGLFQAFLPTGNSFEISVDKKHFYSEKDTITTVIHDEDGKIFSKIEIARKPGYVFDVTVAEAKSNRQINVNAIEGARIEIFNNTIGKEELILKKYPHPNFKFTFEKGNHYTIMIRKEGFLNKRIEAYIDVEGCILCFDGLGIIEPGVTDVLSAGHDIGTFLANIALEPATLNKTFQLENIYYDYNDHRIREDAAEELKKLVVSLKDNPTIIVEMGSHTDARGRSSYNLNLSDRRAKAAMDYLVDVGGINPERLTWKGYGEKKLTNQCRDGVKCNEDEHQANRRTELKIVGFTLDDPLANLSLKEILLEESLMQEVEESEVVRIPLKEDQKNTNQD